MPLATHKNRADTANSSLIFWISASVSLAGCGAIAPFSLWAEATLITLGMISTLIGRWMTVLCPAGARVDTAYSRLQEGVAPQFFSSLVGFAPGSEIR